MYQKKIHPLLHMRPVTILVSAGNRRNWYFLQRYKKRGIIKIVSTI